MRSLKYHAGDYILVNKIDDDVDACQVPDPMKKHDELLYLMYVLRLKQSIISTIGLVQYISTSILHGLLLITNNALTWGHHSHQHLRGIMLL